MAKRKKNDPENGTGGLPPDDSEQLQHMISIVRASGNERLPAGEKEQLWQSIAADLSARPRLWLPRALKIAAAVLLLALAGAWAWNSLYHRSQQNSLLAFALEQQIDSTGGAARLILGNNRQLLLKNARSSIAYKQQGRALQVDSQLVAQAVAGERPVFNTLIVPYGKTATLALEDGTTVWLNAGSRLVYPAVFRADRREVFLEGEAYFDVQQQAGQPFSVYTSGLEVKVLGTTFNVSAYRDDAQQQVVLTGGSVLLEAHAGPLKGKPGKRLLPGNMAAYAPQADDITVTAIQTDEYTSWIEGRITARHTPLAEILKKLSRYYNLPLQVDSRSGRETFSGDLDLQNSLKDVLAVIAATTALQYRQEGTRIIFSNKP